MKPSDLARRYMDCVFKTRNWEELKSILANDLQFRGPFFNFDNAKSYIDSLRNDPPVDFGYKVIKSYSDHSSACLVYQFSKPGISTTMTQVFETKDRKIQRILLIFDTNAF